MDDFLLLSCCDSFSFLETRELLLDAFDCDCAGWKGNGFGLGFLLLLLLLGVVFAVALLLDFE